MAETEQDVKEVDPGHAGRAMRAYSSGLMTLEALADTLLVTPDEAADQVRDAGLTPPADVEEEDPGGERVTGARCRGRSLAKSSSAAPYTSVRSAPIA
jgi:hypothetical protein